MILVGRFTSPFVRRVGISLHLLDLPFTQQSWSPITARDKIKDVNPMGRVPALILDDGEVMIDSSAILDHLDETVGPERALVPPGGAARRAVLQKIAVAMTAMEKGLFCFFERKMRPVETLDQNLLDLASGQAITALDTLDIACNGGWLCHDQLSQADVSAVAALDFLRLIWPEMAPDGRFPKLEALRLRAMELPAFASTLVT